MKKGTCTFISSHYSTELQRQAHVKHVIHFGYHESGNIKDEHLAGQPGSRGGAIYSDGGLTVCESYYSSETVARASLTKEGQRYWIVPNVNYVRK